MVTTTTTTTTPTTTTASTTKSPPSPMLRSRSRFRKVSTNYRLNLISKSYKISWRVSRVALSIEEKVMAIIISIIIK